MQVDDISVFIPCKNYDYSCAFYKALGFSVEQISNELSIATIGECSFILQRYYHKEFAENLMLQLSVLDINEVLDLIISITNFDIKFEGIKQQSWGKYP